MPVSISQIQLAWSALTDAPERARKLATEVTAQIAAIRDGDEWSEQYKADMTAQWLDHGQTGVAELRREVEQARETLLSAATEGDQAAGSDTAQLLAEARTQRAWTRLRSLLDSGRAWHALVAEVEQRRDRDAVQALAEELGAYLRTSTPAPESGVPDWDDAAVAERLDVAAVRVLGDKTGRGRSARMRLHVAARYPVAATVLDAADGQITGRGDALGTAVASHYAEQVAARVEAQLAAPLAA